MTTLNYNDNTIEFEPFELKDDNLRKIRTTIDGDYGEGVWAWFSDYDVKSYDNDAEEGNAVVVLANNPIFLEFPAWKSYVVVEYKGEGRPECDFEKMDGAPIFHHSYNIESDA